MALSHDITNRFDHNAVTKNIRFQVASQKYLQTTLQLTLDFVMISVAMMNEYPRYSSLLLIVIFWNASKAANKEGKDVDMHQSQTLANCFT